MCPATRLSASAARRSCRLSDIPYETTRDAPSLDGVVGQERAVKALRFGVGIRQHGYNLFAVGPPGVGKQTFVLEYLRAQSEQAETPSDWCYVHDFGKPERPRTLELPAGLGARLAHDMAQAVAQLQVSLRAGFESDEYRTRKQQLIDAFRQQQGSALARVQEAAAQQGVAVLQTETGLALAPLHDGVPLEPEKFRALPKDDQETLQRAMECVGEQLQELFHRFHDWGHEHQDALRALDRAIATSVVKRVLEVVRRDYAGFAAVIDHLAQVEIDIVDHAAELLDGAAESTEVALRRALRREQNEARSLRRYEVNVLVDRSGQRGAPVVYEDNPTHANLLGRIDHETQFGALVTDFTLIRAGALHRAMGGYLVLDAAKLLSQPFAWEALKRAVRSSELRIESLGQTLGLLPTVTLLPAPIPLGGTKVLLTGDRALYYLLAALDPDFLELFKVLVDFEESMDRRPETQATYATLLASLVQKSGLRPFDRGAVGRVIEQAARIAGDADKLSVHLRGVLDLLQEADFWAGEAGRALVSDVDVLAAIDAQRERAGRVRDRLREAIGRGDILIASQGEAVGQVNGLAVAQLGEQLFGHPTRISARIRLGKGEVVDIEREVSLGGPIHSKGVLILAGFLGARYAQHTPLALSASIVFEQSYGGVDGDSASLAELCALLSALADVPLKQSLAMTGSVSQHGQVQAIGGVNDKIEGFYEVCKARGLTGEQGVIIPASNVKNLMLRDEVVRDVEEGRFHLYAVDEVDDALALLTGRPAGARDEHGVFPEDSVNGRVEARLRELAERARALSAAGGNERK